MRVKVSVLFYLPIMLNHREKDITDHFNYIFSYLHVPIRYINIISLKY